MAPPFAPEQEITYPEPYPFPSPPNGTEPIEDEDSGLALIAILGIVLGVVGALFIISVVIFFVKRHFANAA
jgi:hypothetical protein